MSSKISLLCFTCVMFFGLAECRVRVQKFVKSQAVFDRTGYSKTLSTRSKIDCGATCVRENSCQKFSYTNGMCLMGESADGPGVMYKSYDKCPADRGYSLWIYDDMQLCLKYNSSTMVKAEATSICENDGGHVVLTENLATRLRINDALTGLGVVDNIWLDGYDAASPPKQFMSWKGEPLAWIEWAPNEQKLTSGEMCLCGLASQGYKHRDLRCYRLRAVVCQKDMM